MKFTAPDKAHMGEPLENLALQAEMKHLLVPTDFSECSYNALRQALVLAARAKAKLTIFHAIHIPMKTAEFATQSLKQLEDDADRSLQELLAEVKAWAGPMGIPVEGQLRTGFPAEEIIEAVKRLEVDLVVMGTQGAGRVEGFLLGSNAATVIGSAACPVIAMPEDKMMYSIKSLVFATDLEVIDEDACRQATLVALLLDADLEMLHLYTPGENVAPEQLQAFERKVQEFCRYPRLKFTTFETFHDNVSASLDQYAREYNVEMLAMLKRERGFFAGLFHASVTRKLATTAHIPLMVMHE